MALLWTSDVQSTDHCGTCTGFSSGAGRRIYLVRGERGGGGGGREGVREGREEGGRKEGGREGGSEGGTEGVREGRSRT